MSPNLNSNPDPATPPQSPIRPLLWAFFLGNSWTWCIGMFLPVLLVRDVGFWGWIVFAAPNVIGAALMGWVIKSPESSRAIVAGHARACGAFSVVTIAFHVFFVLWFVPRLVGLPIASCAFPLAAVYLLLTYARPKSDLLAAAVAWLISLAMFVLFLRTPHAILPTPHLLPNIDALALAPVCLVGFALCPYLDLTFHRARQELPTRAQSKFAFGAGFGVFFFLMIVFSLLYARALDPLLAPEWRRHLRPAFGAILATHMIVQAAFTLAAHARSFAARATPAGVFGLIVLSQFSILAALGATMIPRLFHLDPGEVVYRLFMAFYGLVFPAYVYLCMIPRTRGIAAAPPTRAALRIATLAILAAAPFFWLGFIQNRMLWLLPGVALVLLARLHGDTGFQPVRDAPP